MDSSKPTLQWWRRRSARIALTLVALLLLTAAVPLVEMFVFHNFHEVAEGRVYRSAQMNGSALRAIISQKGVKSIINLRGANGEKAWYRAETNAAVEMGVLHFDIPLSASREVSLEQMEGIVAILKTAPQPLLIHCQSGADRTGLVSALYKLTQEGVSAEKSAEQLTWLRFHFPHLFWRGTIAMDNSFWYYVAAHSSGADVSESINAVRKAE